MKLILDSGAFPHMSNLRHAFDSYFPWPPTAKVQNVLLVDGVSRARILGIGSILISLNNLIVCVLHVPSLSTSLFSIKEHVQYQSYSIIE